MSSDQSNKKPGIIDPPLNVQDSYTLQTWMQQITEAMREATGQIGTLGQSFVRFDDLVAGGVLSQVDQSQQGGQIISPVGDTYTPTISGTPVYDLTPPPAPGQFQITNGFFTVLLTFDFPSTLYNMYAEVWRSNTVNQDDATLLGTAGSGRFTDNIGPDDTQYYYWLRLVKALGEAKVYGPWFSDTGMPGQAQGSLNGDYIEQATIKDAAIHSLGVDKLVGNVADFVTANITDGAITNAKIGNEIASDGYVPGFTGWRLSKGGDAEFSDIFARGTIEGSIIRGSVVEGGLFIQSEIEITRPTEADTGDQPRYLCLASTSTMSASASQSVDSYSLTGGILDLYSANYNLGGVKSYGDGNSVENVYQPLNRYPKFTINPDHSILMYPQGNNDGSGSCYITIYARKHNGTSTPIHSLSLNYPRTYQDDFVPINEGSNYTNKTELLNYAWGTIEHKLTGYTYWAGGLHKGILKSFHWVITIDELPFLYDSNDYTGVYAVVSASDFVKQVVITDVVAGYL